MEKKLNKYFDKLIDTERTSFNCGGFALNTPKWITPYIREDNDFVSKTVCESCPHFQECNSSWDDDSLDGLFYYEHSECACLDAAHAASTVAAIDEALKSCDKTMTARNLSTLLSTLDIHYSLMNRTYIAISLIKKYPKEVVLDVILKLDIIFLLHQFPFLTECLHKDVKNANRLIAYKIFLTFDDQKTKLLDNDFHFKIRINGQWYEKAGAQSIYPTTNFKVWKNGEYIYDSNTVYLIDNRYKK